MAQPEETYRREYDGEEIEPPSRPPPKEGGETNKKYNNKRDENE